MGTAHPTSNLAKLNQVISTRKELTHWLRTNRSYNTLSTHGDPAQAVLDGLAAQQERFAAEARVTIQSDRRKFPPYGLAGGQPGQLGHSVLIREGKERELPGKVSLTAQAGDIISLRTPGGGDYGAQSSKLKADTC